MKLFFALIFSLPICNLGYACESKQHLIVSSGERQPEYVSLSSIEKRLVESSTANSMNWLARFYIASGFSQQMSRECFCVNALAKMKEAIVQEENRLALAALKVGASLGTVTEIKEGYPDNDLSPWTLSPLFAINCLISAFALVGAWLYKNSYDDSEISVAYPMDVSITPVQQSCQRIYGYLNQKWGQEWAHECIMKSMQYDSPCNVTAAREEFLRNRDFFYDASHCCFDKIDPTCNQFIVNYMNNTYPVLYAQAENLYANLTRVRDLAIKAKAVPFHIVVPTVVTLNLLFQLAGYKYRRIMRERAAHSVQVMDEETTSLETVTESE